ncbi:VCBS repeat-containing protein [Maribacter sp. 2307ULW6-5]|uniref:VCBS repeat-containing protein n=1 Tax=Maribacter sp. 2307ULW6-5 TaxID=3386275 RepID=UPI0039BC4916
MQFLNELTYTEEFNPYLYRNFYNGGGVALGDVNNDGLTDIYFTGNMVSNKLFLNKGNWQFEDITEKAGVACENVWSTGATFVDIDQDGLLDLYVCKSGRPGGANRHNELFMNQGDLTFKEASREYGLDIEGLSVHAAFFDHDKDGDLDAYVLNNSLRSIGGFDLIEGQREIPDETGNGNKFFRNDSGKFREVSQEVGIYNSKIGFGLGITLGDFNHDNWTDIYIANDFFERDYLYINNTKGGFTEALEDYFHSISMGAMGADLADLNNDGLPDLMVTEMLPATDQRKKTKTLFESWDKQRLAVKKGYFHQYARNTLQRSYGPQGFLEVGRQAGVADTEWSWGALLFDMDNDGLKDIFVSNGIYKDLLDRDYLAFEGNEEKIRNSLRRREKNVITRLIDAMPSQPVVNGVFKNNGDFSFEKFAAPWGLDRPSFSNGSAYGDLDGDGDLDLVVNNVNMPSFLYENTTDTLTHRSLMLKLKKKEDGGAALGASATLRHQGRTLGHGQLFVSRGFQSSVPHTLHFGLGPLNIVDTLSVLWPNGSQTVLTNVPTNRTLELVQPTEPDSVQSPLKGEPAVLNKIAPPFTFIHSENNYIDFDNERLLHGMHSNEGPALAMADLNEDGKMDVFLGGAKHQSGTLFLSGPQAYTPTQEPFMADKNAEETDALFFDADSDGDMDLYVCHGGRAYSPYSTDLVDALYLNTGLGSFKKSTSSLPFTAPFSSGTVCATDYDHDGDMDLFVGERYKTNRYGRPGSGYLLENDGKGNFESAQQGLFTDLGMITAAQWADLNKDGWQDLIVVGEWMAIKVYMNHKGQLSDESLQLGFGNTEGLWSALHITDLDQDGDLDLIAGNLGRNTFYQAPMALFLSDFDGNGFQEQIICKKMDDKYVPMTDKDELVSQLPHLKKKLLYYKDYARAHMADLFSEDQLLAATKLEARLLVSSVFINGENGFVHQELPAETQYAPIYSITSNDIDKDGHPDLWMGGNQYLVKPQFGRCDASKGWAIFGPHHTMNSNKVHPLNISGQIRNLKWMEHGGKESLWVGTNNDSLQLYEIHQLP